MILYNLLDVGLEPFLWSDYSSISPLLVCLPCAAGQILCSKIYLLPVAFEEIHLYMIFTALGQHWKMVCLQPLSFCYGEKQGWIVFLFFLCVCMCVFSKTAAIAPGTNYAQNTMIMLLQTSDRGLVLVERFCS